jgi:hypothetical protein
MQELNNKIFGQLTENGNVAIFYVQDGDVVTKLDANVYPVNSDLSAKYEHPEGIILSKTDAKNLKIKLEK